MNQKPGLLSRLKNLIPKKKNSTLALMKAFKQYNTWVPDTPGEAHPENPDWMQGQMSDGSHSWFPKKHIQINKDSQFQKTAVHRLPDFLPVKNLYTNMMLNLANHPDRHAIKGGSNGSVDLRLRHVIGALDNRPGYSISHNGTDKITISVPRHSGNSQNQNQTHTWEYSKDGFKFLPQKPIRS